MKQKIKKSSIDDYQKIIEKILKIRKERKSLYGDSYNEMESLGHYFHAFNKFKRLRHQLDLELNHINLANNYEKVDDNVIDIINYLIFFLIMREKEAKSKKHLNIS